MSAPSTLHPWQEMRRLQHEMEHLFGGLAPAAHGGFADEYPPVNLTRNDKVVTLEALCPGVDRPSLDITVVGEAVTIRGERKAEPEVTDERYYRRERPIGAFTRTVSLGERLDPDATQASYRNGILQLQLARAPEATPKKITIQS